MYTLLRMRRTACDMSHVLDKKETRTQGHVEEHKVCERTAIATVRLPLPCRVDWRKHRLRAVAVHQKRSQTCAEPHMAISRLLLQTSSQDTNREGHMPMYGSVQMHGFYVVRLGEHMEFEMQISRSQETGPSEADSG